MKTEIFVTKGILLKKIALTNDDVILEIFSEVHGKISLFAHKLLKSKKRIAEIDFFRLLEFEIQKNRTGTFRLKKVHTKKVYHIFSQDYKKLKRGFLILERLEKTLPQEKPHPNFFLILIETLNSITSKNFYLLLIFLKIKNLQIEGLMPRFDLVRGDIYLNPENLNFYKNLEDEYSEFNVSAIFVKNILRQFLEFLRRSNLKEVVERQDVLLDLDLESIEKILNNIQEYH